MYRIGEAGIERFYSPIKALKEAALRVGARQGRREDVVGNTRAWISTAHDLLDVWTGYISATATFDPAVETQMNGRPTLGDSQ